jgi:hypothetical protein
VEKMATFESPIHSIRRLIEEIIIIIIIIIRPLNETVFSTIKKIPKALKQHCFEGGRQPFLLPHTKHA